MGEKGSGKTSLIQQVLAQIDTSVTVGGIRTHFEIKSQNEKTLFLSPYNRGTNIPVMHFLNGCITVYNEKFENEGVEFITKAQSSQLIVIDELGRFEQDCEQFKNAIYTCLKKTNPIIGVLQIQKGSTWLDEIQHHPNVTTLFLNSQNKNEIKAMIIKHIHSIFL